MSEKPIRIQRKRTKGWKAPPNTVSVTRPGPWGNPFTVGCNAWRFSAGVPYPVPETIDEVLADYRYCLEALLAINPDKLKPLWGKNLMCFCALDKPCHADILLDYANR